MKNIKIILITSGLILSVIGVFYFWVYWSSFRKMAFESQQKKCDFVKSLGFSGTVSKIDRYEYSDYMKDKFFAVDITLPDNRIEHIQFDLKINPKLSYFIRLNQKVKKQLGLNSIDITDSLNNTKTFILSDCKDN